ncbi:MAG: glycosyltransferase family 4 protein [Hydrogenophaga sp.]|uniref:glycosyltransferase family 4 protein n=1 Tax=Hydrogenophaga sp. TaxID=1904254 RepID=UPI00263082B9|nr:glycosyltransferase family 4 protein [Hydrogenophaga sp.]MDM7944170.1 glycosyltransferase family 4 protein [Hydrogenophaga sp.]
MPGPRACCFLIPGDWNIPTGGYTCDRRLVLALREAGWSVEVLVLSGAWPQPDASDLAAAADLIEQLADGTLVVADGLAFGALADVVAPHAARLRWVALVHHPLHLETGLDAQAQERLRTRETQALRHARQVVVTSPRTALDVAAMGVPPRQIAVVEPGTDPVPARDRPATSSGPVALRLLCVATLTPRKGHALLLQALAGLMHLNWTLHNVGSAGRDPGTATRLHGLAAPLGERVFWHGEVDAAALQAHYAAADVFVLPSLHEGYGMVITEALAHGLPVVASDAGALAQTLPAQAGLQVAAGEVAPLQLALERVLSDAALRERLGAGARAAASQLPSWPQQAARFAGVLGEVA